MEQKEIGIIISYPRLVLFLLISNIYLIIPHNSPQSFLDFGKEKGLTFLKTYDVLNFLFPDSEAA